MPQPINQYVTAHLQWITKLTNAIYGGQIPERGSAGVDNVCGLGQWIHGEGGQQYGSLKDFVELKEKHKQFHQHVGEIIDLMQSGKTEEAKNEITSENFRHVSGEVINLLSKLRRFMQ